LRQFLLESFQAELAAVTNSIFFFRSSLFYVVRHADVKRCRPVGHNLYVVLLVHLHDFKAEQERFFTSFKMTRSAGQRFAKKGRLIGHGPKNR
jgi:hypothetical protein